MRLVVILIYNMNYVDVMSNKVQFSLFPQEGPAERHHPKHDFCEFLHHIDLSLQILFGLISISIHSDV